MNQNNVELKPGFTQVCVWPGIVVGESEVASFEKFFADNGFRVQYPEEILTNPDLDQFNRPVPGTGHMNVTVFAIHDDDVMKFALPRIEMGIRWIEDALAPHNSTFHMYPARFGGYKSWDASIPALMVAAILLDTPPPDDSDETPPTYH